MIKQKRYIEKFHSDIESGSFKYDDSKTFDDNMAIYRSNLDDYDKKIFDSNRTSKYWLTFTICVIYASISVILILLGSFTEWGNRVLFNELYIFVCTFIIGTIIIILYLTYKVFSFDFPIIDKKLGFDSVYCPDYWDSSFTFKKSNIGNDHDKLNTDGSKSNYFGKKYNKQQFNLKCHINQNNGVYTSTDLLNSFKNEKQYKRSVGNSPHLDSKLVVELEDKSTPGFVNKTGLNTENDEYNEFRKAAAQMSGYTYNIYGGGNEELIKNNDYALKNESGNYYNLPDKIPLKCDTVYPLFLSKKDLDYAKKNNSNTLNKFRCAYSKSCGIPWTEAGCY